VRTLARPFSCKVPALCNAVVNSGTAVHSVEQSFLAHAITIWHINLGYEEV
jgi:hypothetical protein